MDRRDVLVGSAMAVGAAGMGRAQSLDPAKLARVAIMTYSFDRIIKSPGNETKPGRTLELFDIPEMYADKYKVHNVEVQHDHFASTEPAYFKDFLVKLAKTKSKVSNINLEFFDTTPIYDPTNYLRLQVIDLTKAWIDHAVMLGCPRVMINQGRLSEDNKALAIKTLTTMAEYGKTKNVRVSMEPRGGGGPVGGGRGRAGAPGAAGAPGGAAVAPAAPAPPAGPPFYVLLTDVIKASGTYANVDVGNFGGDQANQQAGIRMMFPYTVGNTHIKLRPTSYDLPAALAIIRNEFKYQGLYSIEAGGGGDPYAAVQAIYDVLVANI